MVPCTLKPLSQPLLGCFLAKSKHKKNINICTTMWLA